MRNNDDEKLDQDLPITSGDKQSLLETLSEYANILRKKKDLYRMMLFICLTLFSVSLLVITTIALYKGSDFITAIQNSSSSKQSSEFIIALASGAFGATCTAFLLYQMSQTLSEIHRYESIVFMLIRRTSQIRDRGKISFAEKIIFELRMADAESILQQRNSIYPLNVRRMWKFEH